MIALMMFILLFLFQFTGVAKQALNEYDVNSYEEELSAQLNADGMYRCDQESVSSKRTDRRYAAFVGDGESGDMENVAWWWCTYTKRGFEKCGSVQEIDISQLNLPEVIIIDGEVVDLENDLPLLRRLTQKGVHLVFVRLPKTEDLQKNPAFCDFLGIRSVAAEQVEIQGMHLFEGFLLGSEKIYKAEDGEEELQDMELKVPWYMTGNGTKTYLMGMLDEDEYENENMPAIVWRKSAGDARIFCVNADYMSHMYGIGFLSAMMADTTSYEIYPVVNAQSFMVADFAGFSEENGEELTKIYSRPQPLLYQEILWPDLVAVTERTKFRITMMALPRLDYEKGGEPDRSQFAYYLKLLKEQYGEAGVSLMSVSDTAMKEKMSQTADFCRESAESYAVLSLYAEDPTELLEEEWADYFPKLRTVAAGIDSSEAAVSYAAPNVTLQHATSDGAVHTYTDDLELMCYETALGYSNILFDMKRVSYPETSKDHWENLSRDMSKNLCTYWQDYQGFSQTTLAQSDARIRKFLALDYQTVQKGRQIILYTTQVERPLWFMMKLNGETPAGIQGGTLKDLENGFYLIGAEKPEVIIDLK